MCIALTIVCALGLFFFEQVLDHQNAVCTALDTTVENLLQRLERVVAPPVERVSFIYTEMVVGRDEGRETHPYPCSRVAK